MQQRSRALCSLIYVSKMQHIWIKKTFLVVAVRRCLANYLIYFYLFLTRREIRMDIAPKVIIFRRILKEIFLSSLENVK